MSLRLARIMTFLSLFMLLLAGAGNSAPAQAADSAGNGVLTIPFSDSTPKIDGNCSDYTETLVETFNDGNSTFGKITLQHDGSYLYVCMRGTVGSNKERFGSLYLDPQGDGSSYEFAAKNDYALHIGIPGTSMSSYNGTDVANGYVANAVIPPFWDGASTSTASTDTIEYRVSLGRFQMGECGKLFGIAAYHHWFAATGDDYGWPSAKYFDQPRTWQLAQLANAPCGTKEPRGNIAYVFRGNTADASSFYNLLTGAGYSVALVPLGSVLATDFSVFSLTIIADDTGDLDQWGIAPNTAAQVAKITAPNKPILGLGEGGYAFFGRIPRYIGWPNGWHGPADSVKPTSIAPAYYANPHVVAGSPVKLYSQPVNEVGIYLDSPPPDVFAFGLEVNDEKHAPLVAQGCTQLWGFSGNPTVMTSDGQNLFINAVTYANTFQCAQPPVLTECSVKKSADPPNGTTVVPGQTIVYTIEYVNCKDERGKLVDTIPAGTIFVAGSASDGISPGPDGSLIWDIGALQSGSKSFKVQVDKTACRENKRIVNHAKLLVGGGALESNEVVHPVNCPPIDFPNDQPTYAEDEIQINPYPLIIGKPSEIRVKLHNNSSSAQTVLVEFQASPDKFGIGIPFNTFDSTTITIPANGTAIGIGSFTPAASGHFCIQIKVTIPGNPPTVLTTQRNLDVTENLVPGQPDTLTFAVSNPTASTADVHLVVDNTCPGWVATVAPPVLSAVAPGEVRNATLTVTPPNPVTLGSGCHIDVQGWIGDHMIGGIRKLDVPPVHLPHDVDPPWAEPEISFGTTPVVAGQPNQICVELQNPLDVARDVTVDFSVADFGAGIPFTTVATLHLTLPPHSNNRYCAAWTPTGTGTLHRCVLVKLSQENYAPMYSQRNVDLVRSLPQRLGELDLPFHIGNPDLAPHTLILSPTLIGINPFWKPVFIDDLGDPAPDVIQPGQTLQLHLKLVPSGLTSAAATAAAPDNYRYGDVSQVEVAVLFDGQQIGGFSSEISTSQLFMPLTTRP